MKWFLLLILFPALSFANPEGAVVISGDAKFSNPAKHALHIHAGDQTILHWKNFSIEAHELTKFIQPSKHSLVLNKVVGGDISAILGTLEANGQVLLINPNGILFGHNAVIETGGFIASTLDLESADFDGELLFQGTSMGGIVNYGTIKAWDGDVTLLSRTIENHGHLEAREGHVNVGVGQEILLKKEGEERIYIRAHEYTEETGIHNLGTISAIQAELRADGNPYTFAIKHDGKIDALNVVEKNGRVLLVAEEGTTIVGGTITASGGIVHVLGDRVGALESAKIDVSSERGGGTILFGGPKEGKDQKVPHATFTTALEGASFLANATGKGDGGTIIFWADGATRVHSHNEARGGAQGGHGGGIEISGKKWMNFDSSYNSTKAPLGHVGVLVLDPDAQIVFDGSDHTADFGISSISYTPALGADDTLTLGFQAIITALQTNDVVIDSHQEGSTVPGGITFPAGLTQTYNSPNTLTIRTGGGKGIKWNGSLKNHGSGEIHLFSTGEGGIKMTPGAVPALIQSEGAIQIGTLKSPIQGNIILTPNYGKSASIVSTGRDVTVYTKGNLDLLAEKGKAEIRSDKGKIIAFSKETISLMGGIITPAQIVAPKSSVNVTAKNEVILDASSGGAYIRSGAGTNVTAISDSISLKGTPFGKATVTGTSVMMGAGTTFDLDNNVTISASGGPITLTSGSDFTVQDIGTPCSITGQSLQLTSINGNITLGNHSRMAASAGAVDIAAGLNLTIQDNFNITQSGKNGITLTASGITPGIDGNVALKGNSIVKSNTSNAFVRGGSSVFIKDNAILSTMGSEGVMIVTDNLTPNGVGPGKFEVEKSTNIHTNGAPVAVYTATRDQNTVPEEGFPRDGTTFTPTTKFVNTIHERWGTFYPLKKAVSPFTLFYKENGLIAISPGVHVSHRAFINILVNYIGPFTVELFRLLHPYNEFTYRYIEFMTDYRDENTDHGGEGMFIRRPSYRHTTSPKISQIPKCDM